MFVPRYFCAYKRAPRLKRTYLNPVCACICFWKQHFTFMCTCVSPHWQSVCLHTCWAVLNWLGPVSMSKQPGEDWGSQMRWLGATEDIITPCVSPAKTGAPKQSFIKVDPHLRWGGGYQLTCCPAVRSGIKLQVERESIQWIGWGGNKKVCRYLQGSRLRHSDCGGSSDFLSLHVCNSAGTLAVLLRVSL